jgi:hypothetical protein
MRRSRNLRGGLSGLRLSQAKLSEAFNRAEAELRADAGAKLMMVNALEILRRRIVSDGYTSKCFKELVTAGCDAHELLWRLAVCSEDPDPDSTDELTGFDNRQLNAFVEQLHKSAKRISEIGEAKVSKIFEVAGISDLWSLPVSMADFGTLLIFVGQLRWRTYWVIAKNRLIDYVFQVVGHYRDKQVAELIAAVTSNAGYTEHVHREWRRRNRSEVLPKKRHTASNPLSRKAEMMVQSVFKMCEWALFKKLQLTGPPMASASSASGSVP